ncbi:hypothetical protein DSL72_002727 [Monilinia vaccinii-corymbosi]|uniref:RNA helicase n=1 Tax=Monilinia vaccinii-corymbosi TaxID=61207 RepID=A0A8A3PDJ5_9HELO|nr:hypothetical protein DSL72_002727 [Monilinia vaccinii-corymbosi]
MPEKVLVKFGDGVDEAPVVVEKAGASGEKGLKGAKGTKQKQTQTQSQSQSQSAKSTGTKRLRDGSPKLDGLDSKRKRLVAVPGKVANANGNGAKLVKLADVEGTGAAQKQIAKDAGVSNGVGSQINGSNGVKLSGDKKGQRGQGQRSGGESDGAKTAVPDRHLQKTAKELEPFRKSLPVYKKMVDLKADLRNKDVLLLTAETGSGKSTQLPQFMHDEPWCKKQKVKVKNTAGQEEEIAVGGVIAITQPRRVAAITLARRVAAEMGSALGYQRTNTPGKVGYSVRFDTNTPPGMKIKFVTEGTLLQEMVHDPNLRRYSAVIIDEIHERGVDVDLIAGFLRQIVHGDKKGRGGIPLKIVIMSATLDLGGYETFFANPESRPNYQPGNNYGSIFASRLLKDERVIEAAKSMQAIKSGDSENVQLKGTEDSAKPDTGVAIEEVEGRKFKVELYYDKPADPSNYQETMFKRIASIHVTEPLPGDILVFLVGQEEIEYMQARLEALDESLSKDVPRIKVIPLYGALPPDAQQLAFEPVKEPRTRKIVLATNIAETSVTVPGVRYVVDSGRAKVKKYRTKLGMESLLVVPISKQSALQRMGRAGREAPGKCWRAYGKDEYESWLQDEIPEILRCDVLEAVLKMKARGVQDVINFPLMDSPDVEAMKHAILQLNAMGALDDEGNLTPDGKKMASFPLPAAYGRALIASSSPEFNCVLDAIDVISLLTAESEVFIQPKSQEQDEEANANRADILRREGDLLTYLTTMQRYVSENTNRFQWCKSRNISARAMKSAMMNRKQLRQLSVTHDLIDALPPPDPQPFEPATPERAECLIKAFLRAFADRTATLAPDGSFVTTRGKHPVTIHPQSVLWGKKLEAIMFLENVFSTKNWAKKVSGVQADWVVEALGGWM